MSLGWVFLFLLNTILIPTFSKTYPPVSNSPSGKNTTKISLPKSTRLLKLRIYDLQIVWDGDHVPASLPLSLSRLPSASSGSSKASEKVGPANYNCMIYFPLQNEDPLAPFRKSVLMNQALSGSKCRNGSSTPAVFGGKNMQYIHSFKFTEDEEGGVHEVRSVVAGSSAK